jgi:hypothetical protein
VELERQYVSAEQRIDYSRVMSKPVWHPWAAMSVALLIYGFFNAIWWGNAWDDMAITLGFARTLADAGLVAPTPLSDPVEGTSSLLWMGLHAIIYKLHGHSELLFHQAKYLCIAFLVLNAGLIFAVSVTCGISKSLATLVSVSFSGSYVAIIESINGMENPLFLFLYCIVFISYFNIYSRYYFSIFLISSSALIFIRWEGIWFLLPFFLINGWRFGYRGLFAAQHWLWVGLFAGQTLWRVLTFGDFIPNTVRAKAQAPYSPAAASDFGNAVELRISTLLHEIVPFKAFLLIAACALALILAVQIMRAGKWLPAIRRLYDDVPWPIRLLAAISIAGCIFAMFTGRDYWGYSGRMFFIAAPFLIALAAWLLQRSAETVYRRTALPVIVMTLATLFTVGGGITRAHQHLRSNAITVTQVAQILPALETAKRLTGQPKLTIAHSDLGALVLYGETIRVIDTALLCNPVLAKEGYTEFERQIFEKEQPGLIQTHGMWTTLSRIAEMGRLYADYVPLFVNGVRFFIRSELLKKIPTARLQRRRFSPDGRTEDYSQDLLWTKHSGRADFEINRQFGYYWVPVSQDLQSPR